MGWEFCGKDSAGRQIGYGIQANCDEPDCDTMLDRGLSYVCGGMHGNGDHLGHDFGCEKYFCEKHLEFAWPDGENKPGASYCKRCAREISEAVDD